MGLWKKDQRIGVSSASHRAEMGQEGVGEKESAAKGKVGTGKAIFDIVSMSASPVWDPFRGGGVDAIDTDEGEGPS